MNLSQGCFFFSGSNVASVSYSRLSRPSPGRVIYHSELGLSETEKINSRRGNQKVCTYRYKRGVCRLIVVLKKTTNSRKLELGWFDRHVDLCVLEGRCDFLGGEGLGSHDLLAKWSSMHLGGARLWNAKS